ncbi:MAG TPA: DUF222 domain-containing protein [Candidatus Nanopelagicales bacterium]|nr:DUF222 domain-containing protein [Candidatus Nanopelagicales bacterium]
MSLPVDERQPADSALRGAVEELGFALQRLIKLVDDGALNDLGALGLVGFLQDYEQVRNMMPTVDRAAIEYGTGQGVPATLTQRGMAQVLSGGLRISAAEAGRRVRAAEHLADRLSQVGEPLGPYRPDLARAQREGAVTPEQVGVIDTALRRVDRCDPAAVAAGERLLVEAAAELGPRDLAAVAGRLVDAIDPDGAAPADEAEHRRRRAFTLRQRDDGSWSGELRLTPELGQKLAALLGPLMAPAKTGCQAGDGQTGTDQTGTDRAGTDRPEPGQPEAEPDDRTTGQRRHDALEALLDRLLRGDSLPDSGGTPTTLIIHLTYRDYIAAQGAGRYADGSPVSARVIDSLADQAEVAWCVKDARGAVLELHRTRRIASRGQAIALYARDGGCSFPGCEVAPEYCERHHIVAWQDGGPTNLDNLTLLCRYHHHRFAARGWACRLSQDRLPEWIPPKWMDREQRPILNHRIKIARWNPRDPLDLT